ncbi:MAG: hypothetical protein MJZ03_01930 [archaeon]|nr:hypothetical protein [archaeon]
MLSGRNGFLLSNFALSTIVFAVLIIIFAVCALSRVDIWVDVLILIVMMTVGFFGILPHISEEE